MSITKRLLALLAGGSAVGAGVAGAAVTTQEATAPDPVEVGGGATSLDIEGDQVRVQAQASPLDDLLDSANTAGSPDTPGTEDRDTAGTNSANTNTPNSANTNSPDTPNTNSVDTGTGDSPATQDSADSPDNSGPGSLSSGPGSGGAESADSPDNSGPGSGDDDNSGSGSDGDDNSGSGS